MQRFDWDENIHELTRYGTFKDFIWENYSIAQMKADLAENREDFLRSMELIKSLDGWHPEEIEGYCDKEEAVELCAGQSDEWDDVQALQANTAIYRSLEEFYNDHAELFDQHPDKKIIEVLSWEPATIWRTAALDLSSAKTLSGFIRANCYGRDVLFAHHYGNLRTPHVYPATGEKLYKQYGPEIEKYLAKEPKFKGDTAPEKVNAYIQGALEDIYDSAETDIKAAPTMLVEKILTPGKNLERT